MDLTEIKTIDDYLKELSNLYFKVKKSGDFAVAYEILNMLGREIVSCKSPSPAPLQAPESPV